MGQSAYSQQKCDKNERDKYYRPKKFEYLMSICPVMINLMYCAGPTESRGQRGSGSSPQILVKLETKPYPLKDL